MKTIIVFMTLSILASCASGPTKILVKNCKAVGSDLYSCEKIPKKEIEPRK